MNAPSHAASYDCQGASRKWIVLDLSYNQLSGTIPEIGAQASLQQALLKSNNLIGALSHLLVPSLRAINVAKKPLHRLTTYSQLTHK